MARKFNLDFCYRDYGIDGPLLDVPAVAIFVPTFLYPIGDGQA